MQQPPSRALCWLPLLLTTLPLLAATPPVERAVAAKWTAVGPNGGAVRTLAAAPAPSRTLYAGTAGGFYVSTDAGATWILQARQIGQQPIDAIAVDPVHPQTLYAGTPREGVWKSTDGGASWNPANHGLPALGVHRLAIDPVRSAVLYASQTNVPSGLFKTTDGGNSWKRATQGLDDDRIEGIAIDPASTSVLYVAERENGLFKSTDAGATWHHPVTPFAGAVRVEARREPAGSGGSTFLFAVATATMTEPEAIFRSADGGATWVDVTPGPTALSTDYPLAFGPGGMLYTNGAKSADLGDHWMATTKVGPGVNALLVDLSAAQTLYAAGNSGVSKSVDGAGSWAGASHGLHATTVALVAVNPQSGGVLAGVSGSGLVRLRQAARSVESDAWRPVLAETPGFLVFDPSRPSTVYAGLNGSGRDGNHRIAKSNNGGETWTQLPLANPCLDLAAVAVDPTDSTVLYAGGMPGDAQGCLHGPALTFKSTDGGATWKTLTLATAVQLLVDPFDPRTVYALSTLPNRVYKSTDHGATWHLASQGLGSGALFELAIDTLAPGRLAASGTDGIYVSHDGARSWQRATQEVKNATVVLFDPARMDRLLAGVPGVGVFLSRNLGEAWSPLNDGHLPALVSGALAVDPTHPGRVYVGTEGAGLFQVDVTPAP